MTTKGNSSPKYYFIGGVNGVGKTTVLEHIVNFNKNRKNKKEKYILLKGSCLLMKWLGIKDKDYKTLRTLNPKLKNRETGKMILQIMRSNHGKGITYLFDGHFIHYNNGKPVDVIGDWIKKFSILIFISASTKNILNRSLTDKNKERDLFPSYLKYRDKIKIISEYQKITLEKVKEISRKFGIPFIIIKNNSSIDHFVEKFIQIEKTLDKKIK
jgi:adenylate kinase